MNESKSTPEAAETTRNGFFGTRVADYHSYGLYHILLYPFAIYGKQFPKFFLLALIPEFIFFGIFRLVNIDINYSYTTGFFSAAIHFYNDSDAVAAFFFILLFLAAIIFLLRSGTISAMTWKTIDTGKANPFWSLEATLKQFWKFVIATGIFIFALVIPFIFMLLALIFSGNDRLQGLSWFLLVVSIGIPLIFGSRISLYSTGITKDYYPAGTAFQKSWQYTKGKYWLRI